MKRYDPKSIEPKWQKRWADQELYKAVDFDTDRPKFVMLTEFPYPSGDGLHMGHMREYTLGDVVARHKRMNGYNVLFPMGYDAFGLPTENYAIKHKIAPQVATDRNVANIQKQFDALGSSIDWTRSFRTTDPSYYKWTQWLFLQFFKHDMAYQAEVDINWCPFCKTGLANEEVVNGRHERCDTIVEKKTLNQWMLRITDYADRLIDGLQTVDYPSRIADQQINWIGRSKGAEVDFRLDDHDDSVTVFTTRPDTLYGATFIVLAPEHPLVEEITTEEQRAEVHSYVKATQAKTEIERQDANRDKTGVATGSHTINPVNGAKIPIWIADYVLMGYGTGAIMAVPAHDERDFEFAKKYELPIVRVIKNEAPDDACTHEEGSMINSGNYDDMPSAEAREKIVKDLRRKVLPKRKSTIVCETGSLVVSTTGVNQSQLYIVSTMVQCLFLMISCRLPYQKSRTMNRPIRVKARWPQLLIGSIPPAQPAVAQRSARPTRCLIGRVHHGTICATMTHTTTKLLLTPKS